MVFRLRVPFLALSARVLVFPVKNKRDKKGSLCVTQEERSRRGVTGAARRRRRRWCPRHVAEGLTAPAPSTPANRSPCVSWTQRGGRPRTAAAGGLTSPPPPLGARLARPATTAPPLAKVCPWPASGCVRQAKPPAACARPGRAWLWAPLAASWGTRTCAPCRVLTGNRLCHSEQLGAAGAREALPSSGRLRGHCRCAARSLGGAVVLAMTCHSGRFIPFSFGHK